MAKDKNVLGGNVGLEGQGREEEHNMQELKQINNQLYKFAMKNVLSS